MVRWSARSAPPGLSTVVKYAAGIAHQRQIPLFAPQRFTDWFTTGRTPASGSRGTVLLWPDTFTNNMHPSIGRAAVELLESAGFEVTIPARTACCALTWISTGQLTTAKHVLRRTLDVLRPHLRDGTPMVVLEPSCAATFRADLPELLHGDEDAHRLVAQTHTLAEFLHQRAPHWQPDLTGQRAIAQVHCHQHAVLGFHTDQHLMWQGGLELTTLDAGCCGLAGNFGFERGHYDLSMACAEDKLLPAISQTSAHTTILADGFGCRTQIQQSRTGRVPVHLAEVLAAARGETPHQRPDQLADRPTPPTKPARVAATAAAAASAALDPSGWCRGTTKRSTLDNIGLARVSPARARWELEASLPCAPAGCRRRSRGRPSGESRAGSRVDRVEELLVFPRDHVAPAVHKAPVRRRTLHPR